MYLFWWSKLFTFLDAVYTNIKKKYSCVTYVCNVNFASNAWIWNWTMLFFVAVKWHVINKHTQIGDEAILSCNANDCTQTMRQTWYGGRSNDLLCYNDISTNPKKYEMKSSNSSFNSSLIIKKFNISDINCKYTCACGFRKYTQMLKLHDLHIVCKYFQITVHYYLSIWTLYFYWIYSLTVHSEKLVKRYTHKVVSQYKMFCKLLKKNIDVHFHNTLWLHICNI